MENIKLGPSGCNPFGKLSTTTSCAEANVAVPSSQKVSISMFNWSSKLKICYAYLEDVSKDNPSSFTLSRRFARVWTLQELLAPKDVLFHDKDWTLSGSKAPSNSQRCLVPELSSITGSNKVVLEKWETIFSQSITYQMPWAATRNTTYAEDEAYCLLGIFKVNIPFTHRKERGAFIRVQEEIDNHSRWVNLCLGFQSHATRRVFRWQKWHTYPDVPLCYINPPLQTQYIDCRKHSIHSRCPYMMNDQHRSSCILSIAS